MHADLVVETNVKTKSGFQDQEEGLVEWIRQKTVALNKTQDDFHSFHFHMRDLERSLLRGEDKAAFFERVIAQLTQKELKLLNDLYCLWETILERRFVNFLDNDVVKHYLDYPLFARFERLIEREVSLLQGIKPKRVLFIGSGPMPITALCLSHRLDVPIDCLEKYSTAVDDSKIVMRKLGMEGAINILHGRGEEVDVSDYDVVLVALLAKPKKAILENILKTGREDIRVICRTSDNSRHVFYEPTLNNAIPDPFVIKDYARAGIDDTISSVLLQKELQS